MQLKNLFCILIVFTPLFSSVFLKVLEHKLSKQFAVIFANFMMFVPMLCALYIFYCVYVFDDHSYTTFLFNWLQLPGLVIDFSIVINPLIAVMLVVITVISFLVHIFSIGYMGDDDGLIRFLSYLSFFTAAMILLVVSNNLLQLFMGWELVGFASYLLIGFWCYKESANLASMKAFIVNRVGDLGLIIGIIALHCLFGSLNIDNILMQASHFSSHSFVVLGVNLNSIEVICLLLFCGAMAKSAQFGLHTWLPDAMEGPTPVSALIHAATMVTAGVFLIARLSALFEVTTLARLVVATFGGCNGLICRYSCVGAN